MFIYRCHVFPPQGLGCYASSVSHSFSNLWFREILVPYFMGKWQAAKQPSSQACVAVDVDDQMDDDLLFYIDLHFLDKKCQESRLLTRKCCEDV